MISTSFRRTAVAVCISASVLFFGSVTGGSAQSNRATAAAQFTAKILPYAPEIAAFCAKVVEGGNPSDGIFASAGFKRAKSIGRPTYIIDIPVGSDGTGMTVIHRKNGCQILMPNNKTADAFGFYESAIAQLAKLGYHIAKGSGGQTATKGSTKIKLKMKARGNSFGSAIHFTMLGR